MARGPLHKPALQAAGVVCLTILSGASALGQNADHVFIESPAPVIKAFERGGQHCGRQMEYTLQAAVPETFYPSSEHIEIFLGNLRAALSLSCPNAQRILLTGYVGDALYFAGEASAKDWRLVSLSAPPPQTP